MSRLRLVPKQIDNAPAADEPPPVYDPGTKVEVKKGEIFKDTLDGASRSAAGVRARVDGNPYVAVGGPKKGRIMQTVKEVGTGRLYAVDASDLKPESGRTCKVWGFSPSYAANYDAIFGKK